jgi:hypothetical protein
MRKLRPAKTGPGMGAIRRSRTRVKYSSVQFSEFAGQEDGRTDGLGGKSTEASFHRDYIYTGLCLSLCDECY